MYIDLIPGKTAINRQQQGLAIANITGTIKRISELKYFVKSQSGNGDYEINSTDLGWVCSCPDPNYRGVKGKHIFAVEISYTHYTRKSKLRANPLI
ncbi:MAG: hypothetical protein WBE68_22110 [Candidatus Nitrosopolaris sp.]